MAALTGEEGALWTTMSYPQRGNNKTIHQSIKIERFQETMRDYPRYEFLPEFDQL
jgi:hypothetical protein